MGHAVVIARRGDLVMGHYNGYGQVGDGDYSLADINEFSMYHKDCWELSGKPGYTKPSRGAIDQGCCLACHGSPLPRPTGEFLNVWAPMAHAVEAFFDAYQTALGEWEMDEIVATMDSLAPDARLKVLKAYQETKAAHAKAYNDAHEAWIHLPIPDDDEDDVPSPKREDFEMTKFLTVEGVTVNTEWFWCATSDYCEESGDKFYLHPKRHWRRRRIF